MIAKASQRENGQQLAIHLLNAYDNEHVEIAEISGAIARDLQGALKEWHALSRVTRCKKYLYSLSVNPDPGQNPLTRRQYKDYITRVEQKLGLAGQPRAVVFHIKDGREHCHVVWSRIIPDQLKAVQISHDRKTLQTLTRRFAKDHGLHLPANMRKTGSPKNPKLPKNESLSENQQQERTGIAKEQRAHTLTKIWRETNTGQAFSDAMAQAGFHLARGKSVSYAVIDSYGEIHSLARQIEGVRTRDLRARLKDFPPESLPDAQTLRDEIQTRLQKQITSHFNHNAQRALTDLQKAQDKRRSTFHKKLATLKEKHKTERQSLIATQKETLQKIRDTRFKKTGFQAILSRLPGVRTLIAKRHKREDMVSLKSFKQERRDLIVRQRSEFDDLKRQSKGIARVEKRELRSLKTKLRRDFLQAHLTPTPSEPAASSPHGHKPARGSFQDSLAAAFSEKPLKKPSLRDAFHRATNPDITAKACINGAEWNL